MIDLEAAWQILDEAVQPLETELVPLDEAVGRIVHEQLASTGVLPPFDNSAMDGYAIRSVDVAGASDEHPVSLRVLDETYAGDEPGARVDAGGAVQVMTGAPVAQGADAVLRLEDGRLRDGHVEVRAPIAAGRHVRRAGEDVAAGDLLIAAGDRLRVGDLGLLASAGVDRVSVSRRPVVGVLVTGNELRPVGSTLAPGQIHDSNGPVLRALAAGAGYQLVDHGIVGDDRSELETRIAAASKDADVLVLSGGVSVGRRDFVKRVLEDMGAERLFWRVRMKPGKPLLCARLPNGCLVVGLPGNPVSALAGWALFVEPVLRRLGGDVGAFGPVAQSARLRSPVRGDEHRIVMATAQRELDDDGSWWVRPTRSQGSAMLRSMADGNCFARIDTDAELAEGDVVTTYGYEHA